MADKEDMNEEYQFTELDSLNPEILDDESASADAAKETTSKVGRSSVKHNAIIVVCLFVLVVLIYKFTGSALEEKKIEPLNAPTSLTVPPAPTSSDIEVPAETVIPTVGINAAQDSVDIQTKMSNVEASQESIRSDLTTFSAQVSSMNNTLDALTSKIAGLTETITALNTKLEAQALEITRLTVKQAPRVAQRYRAHAHASYLRYYIQAVIPGRAWLVATNGTTLTVREGSTIPGYGLVKLIDPSQGRILTGSGQMIRFSQDDS